MFGPFTLIAIVAFLVAGSSVERFRAASEAMAPTIEANEEFTVNKDAYDEADPRIGDIVVFHPPKGAVAGLTEPDGPNCGERVGARELCPRPTEGQADVTFVKRVVAGPGDRLRIEDGKAVVNGEALDEPYARDCGGVEACTFRDEITIPADHWFLMGDNRGASDDSRFWGPVHEDALVGRVDDCTLGFFSCDARGRP